MRPGDFDAPTARIIVGDARMRVIEAQARTDAEGQGGPAFTSPLAKSKTYWGQVQAEMERSVYLAAYSRRKARLERKGK